MTKKLIFDLIEMRKAYVDAYNDLYESVVEYMEKYDADAQFKVTVDEFDFICIRCTIEIDKSFLNAFCEDFDLTPAWDRKEIMNDFRNIEEASVEIFEYAFMKAVE